MLFLLLLLLLRRAQWFVNGDFGCPAAAAADVDHDALFLHNLDHCQTVAEWQYVFHGKQRPWQYHPLRLRFYGRILGNVPRIHDFNAEQCPRPPFALNDVFTITIRIRQHNWQKYTSHAQDLCIYRTAVGRYPPVPLREPHDFSSVRVLNFFSPSFPFGFLPRNCSLSKMLALVVADVIDHHTNVLPFVNVAVRSSLTPRNLHVRGERRAMSQHLGAHRRDTQLSGIHNASAHENVQGAFLRLQLVQRGQEQLQIREEWFQLPPRSAPQIQI